MINYKMEKAVFLKRLGYVDFKAYLCIEIVNVLKYIDNLFTCKILNVFCKYLKFSVIANL